MDAGLASTLLFLYPLEVSVLMAIFFKEKIKAWTVVSIAVSMSGVALLYRGGDGVPLSTAGLALVFASSLSYAIYMVMANRINLQMGSVKMTFYAICFCLVFLLLYSVTFEGLAFGAAEVAFLGFGQGAFVQDRNISVEILGGFNLFERSLSQFFGASSATGELSLQFLDGLHYLSPDHFMM